MKKINILIIVLVALIAASLLFFSQSNFDINLQNHFFDKQTGQWLIDASSQTPRLIFYILPKVIFGVASLILLICTIFAFKKKNEFLFQNRHKFALILLGFALIPLIVGNIKKFTNIYCPNQLEIYSGKYPHWPILKKYDENFKELQKTISPKGEVLKQGKISRGQCFPAGHSVTGFALFILFFAFEKKAYRISGFFAAFVFGWVLSFYQILKGAHFFSHNFVTMLACFLLAAIITRSYKAIVNN